MRDKNFRDCVQQSLGIIRENPRLFQRGDCHQRLTLCTDKCASSISAMRSQVSLAKLADKPGVSTRNCST